MPKTAIKIGPDDHGRRMALDDFSQAEGQEGYLYELSRGVVTVTDVPKLRHLAQVLASRRQFSAYDLSNPGLIYAIASGSECKILLTLLDTERHPDLAIYKSIPPASDEEGLWAVWIPDIVLEIVSPGSEHRDYVEKVEEYLLVGVREYWIIDAKRAEMRVLRRRNGRWSERTVRAGEAYRTRLLPGFAFDVAAVFDAAKATES